MFTGIVEDVGYIQLVNDISIEICCSKILDDMKIGDSIAVDGTCLTVIDYNSSGFVANISDETKKVTKIGELKKNDIVNLERAMIATSRFGGHIVTGHIDCVARVKKLYKLGEFYDFEVEFPSSEFVHYFVKRGSITIDGISLTIKDLSLNGVCVSIIPHTFENTNLKRLNAGSFVNIEFDILSKYVEKNLLMNDNKDNITKDFLKDNGFI